MKLYLLIFLFLFVSCSSLERATAPLPSPQKEKVKPSIDRQYQQCDLKFGTRGRYISAINENLEKKYQVLNEGRRHSLRSELNECDKKIVYPSEIEGLRAKLNCLRMQVDVYPRIAWITWRGQGEDVADFVMNFIDTAGPKSMVSYRPNREVTKLYDGVAFDYVEKNLGDKFPFPLFLKSAGDRDLDEIELGVVVSIADSGEIYQLGIRRSSTSEDIDQQVLTAICELAPFDRFPHSLSKDYDVLDISFTLNYET